MSDPIAKAEERSGTHLKIVTSAEADKAYADAHTGIEMAAWEAFAPNHGKPWFDVEDVDWPLVNPGVPLSKPREVACECCDGYCC